MAKELISETDFIRLFEEMGARPLARRLKSDERAVLRRRERIERRIGHQIKAPEINLKRGNGGTRHSEILPPGRLEFNILNGIVLVGTDPHYWPGEATTAHRGFVKFCKMLKPRFVVMNGDVLDGSTISRHAPIGWEKRPSLIEEIEIVKERLDEITMACSISAEAAWKTERIWTLGNHDARFETRLATIAPEYAKVHGVHLKDHYPDWQACWDVWFNPSGCGALTVKHRFKSGIHAPWNNTMYAGRSITTGHLHSLKVYPFTDFNGTRFGSDAGTMADPSGPQFNDYMENNPANWRAGFMVHEFKDGRMLWPSPAHVLEPGLIEFERKLYEV